MWSQALCHNDEAATSLLTVYHVDLASAAMSTVARFLTLFHLVDWKTRLLREFHSRLPELHCSEMHPPQHKPTHAIGTGGGGGGGLGGGGNGGGGDGEGGGGDKGGGGGGSRGGGDGGGSGGGEVAYGSHNLRNFLKNSLCTILGSFRYEAHRTPMVVVIGGGDGEGGGDMLIALMNAARLFFIALSLS